jgi:probable HAF family extracellular repeat protein
MQVVMKKVATVLLATCVLGFMGGTAFAGSWTLINLNTQGNIRYASASGINNNGDIVGQAAFEGDTYEHAALWRNGVTYNLGSLGSSSGARAINDAGLIAGGSYTSNNIDATEAVILSPGAAPVSLLPYTLTMQPGPLYGISDSGVAGINTAGQMVGQAFGWSGNHLPILWSSDGTINIQATIQEYDAALMGINNVGQMVGWAQNTAQHSLGYAAIWENGTVSLLTQPDGASGGAAEDINDSGVAVGTVWAPYGNAAVWSNGSVQLLPGLGGDFSSANAINSSGLIVGSSRITAGGASHAVLWKDGLAIDLNSLVADSGLTLEGATDINDNGWIVGVGHTADKQQFAFLLAPDAIPTPIPATLPLFGSALAVIGAVRRKLCRA